MIHLLDGNVLVALCLEGHVHHGLARRWFVASSGKFATCAVTEGTLLRLHMTMAVDGSANAAWGVLRALHDHPRHVFWEEGFSYASVPHRSLQGAKQVTDAWLAEAYRRRKARLATLDSALAALHRDVAELIR